ncbi:hypothetical protein HAX54_013091 [Datura stramonium]|uniref:Uncharacterized protein ycf33 n=1 Tax=Datura stramonium TaxID=4076 RepID=A0ABS8RYQ0_DATST|nr:hypothetical protein [Datura stramonium]
MKLQLHFRHSNLPLLIQLKNNPPIKKPKITYGKREIYKLAAEKRSIAKPVPLQIFPKSKKFSRTEISESKASINEKSSNLLVLGAVSVGLVMFLMGFDDKNQALALGPEGPLMEEFWDNMRRYGLYALTVSTGVLWAVFQPIYELLKNPISAILVLIIMGGSVYIVTQVVSAMVEVEEILNTSNLNHEELGSAFELSSLSNPMELLNSSNTCPNRYDQGIHLG